MIPNLSGLDLVSNLLDNALRRQQDILGHVVWHHTTSESAKEGEGIPDMFQAEVNVKILKLEAVQIHL